MRPPKQRKQFIARCYLHLLWHFCNGLHCVLSLRRWVFLLVVVQPFDLVTAWMSSLSFVLVRRFLCSLVSWHGQLSNEVDIMYKKISSYSVINPVIYGFFNENFKREFLLLKHMVKYWMNEYDWKLCKDCKNYLGSLSFLNNLCHALSFSFCQGCHQCHTGVHFSFYVLPSWADKGSCAHKCVC